MAILLVIGILLFVAVIVYSVWVRKKDRTPPVKAGDISPDLSFIDELIDKID